MRLAIQTERFLKPQNVKAAKFFGLNDLRVPVLTGVNPLGNIKSRDKNTTVCQLLRIRRSWQTVAVTKEREENEVQGGFGCIVCHYCACLIWLYI